MKQTARILIAAAIFTLVPAGVAIAAETQILVGKWAWNQGGRGDLEAVFTPTGPATWDVAFHFKDHGRRHVYEGTARGSLTEGRLEGRVRTETGRRTFTFSGKFKNGKLKGTHAEVERRRQKATGTLSLEPKRATRSTSI